MRPDFYNVVMPTLGPEQYAFSAYIHYENGDKSKPHVIAYWHTETPPSAEEADALQRHAEEEDIDFTLIVVRTVTENQFKHSQKTFGFSVAGEQREAALSAIKYLKQIHPGEFEKFAQACWESAWARLSQNFPQSWPKE